MKPRKFMAAMALAALTLTVAACAPPTPAPDAGQAEQAQSAGKTATALVGKPDQIKEQASRAMDLLAQGQVSAGALEAQAAFHADAASPWAVLAMAQAYVALRQPRRALALLDQLQRMDGRFFAAHDGDLLRGRIALAAGRDAGQTVSDLTAVAARQPQSAEIAILLGRARLAQGQGRAAVADFDRAMTLEPAQTKALLWRGKARAGFDPAGAMDDFDRYIQGHGDDPQGYLARATLRARQKEALSAIRDMQTAMDLLNASPDEQQRLFELENKLVKAANPQFATRTIGDTAALLARPGLAGVAEALYALILAIDPENTGARVDLAAMLISLGHGRQAIVELETAITPATRGARPYLLLATAWRMEAPQGDQALAPLNRALELEPDNATALLERGRLHLDRGRYQQALADLNRAVALDPGSAKALYWRAVLFNDRLGQPGPALADLNSAIALDPGGAELWMARGAIHLAAGNATAALADLDKAAALGPDWPRVLLLRAAVCRKAGDDDAARRDLGRCLILDPGNVEAFADLVSLENGRPAAPPVGDK